MKKRNVYMAQPTYMSASSVHFPYGIGALISYAWKFEDVRDAFELKDAFFLRENTDAVVSRLEEPFLMGFSCYMWNIEYNKVLARKVKRRFPSCVVVFGGPQVPADASLLEENGFVDVLIHGEGEVPFLELLRTLLRGAPPDGINNISFLRGGAPVTTLLKTACEFDFPSPFASGFYDRLMREHPDVEFVPLLETSRGCPNHCAYCSWAASDARVRLFPLERVYKDLEWVSEHKMEFFGLADANFGLFPRDELIADKVIELNERTGFPKKFQISYAKDSGDRVFRISEKLNRVGLCKGVTLSFQTMSEEAQRNIGRSNMDIAFYKELLRRYAEAGVPTYTELIIGLPGETFRTFSDGIEDLLENGQHTSLVVHLCEWLPLSGFGNKEYLEKYKIGYTRVPLSQPHAIMSEAEEVQEYSRIITSTYSMPVEEWMRTVLFATCVVCFHHLGLLQMPALYLHREKGVPYARFYEELLSLLLAEPGNVFGELAARLCEIAAGQASAVMYDPRFGDVVWPFEEYAFLQTVYRKDAFYASVRPFLSRWIGDEALLDDLLAYQSFAVKTVGVRHAEYRGRHKWKPYFEALVKNEPATLRETDVRYAVDDENVFTEWPAYARTVLWYGRRGGKYLYTAEMKEICGDV